MNQKTKPIKLDKYMMKVKNCILNKKFVLRFIFVLCTVFLLSMLGYFVNKPDENEIPTSYSQVNFSKAVVTAVLSDDTKQDYELAEGRRVGTQELEIKITSGEHKDEIMTMTNYLSAMFNVDVSKGDHIIVRILKNEEGTYYASMFNYNRAIVMGAFILIFFAAMIILGGRKGVAALVGLLFTLISIWYILIPAIIHGIPSIPITIAIIAITATGSLTLLNGFSKKTICAILGCVGGVMIAGLTALIVGKLTPLNGLNMSEAENLILYGADKGLKVSGLLVCGILIAALGAVMDIALGIASSIWELHINNEDMSSKQLFYSGMQIGKDMMGTMANTLILAFVGSSLNMLILIQTYDIPFLQFVNTDYICIEVIQSIASSLGLLLTVPLVAFISANLMAKENTGVQDILNLKKNCKERRKNEN